MSDCGLATSKRSMTGQAICSLGEALLWTVGYLLAQVVALAAFVTILWIAAFGIQFPDLDTIQSVVLELELDRSFLPIAVGTIGAMLILIPLVRLREGKDFRTTLGWQQPRADELVYALATVIPAAMLSDVLAAKLLNLGSAVDSSIFNMQSLEYLSAAMERASYPVVVIAMALAPAVGEEFVFRGVLGRRLVNRFGAMTGVAITSLLFAAAHGSPVHAVATLPLGILLHVLYLWTGTIWIPVIVHFCNNLLAISIVRFDLPAELLVSPLTLSWLSFYLLMMLWQIRLHSSAWQTAAVHETTLSGGI